MLEHYMYWGLNRIPAGMYTNVAGDDTLQWFEDIDTLGIRVAHAFEQERIGFGGIFDMHYDEYLREHGQE